MKAPSLAARARQRGAAGLEFALQFLVFFVVFYAIVSYGLAMMLIQAFNHAAAEGARAAVRLDPLSFQQVPLYQEAARSVSTAAARDALAWLPARALDKIKAADGVQVSWTTPTSGVGNVITVQVRYLNYRNEPLVPFLVNLPGFGTVPSLPDDLTGSASLQL